MRKNKNLSIRTLYTVTGLIVGAVVNLLINLLAAVIQEKGFINQLTSQPIWWLIGLILAGLLIGYWLGVLNEKSATAPSHSGIEARNLKTRVGSVEVVTQTSKDMLVEDVEAGLDIAVRDETGQSDPTPKANPLE